MMKLEKKCFAGGYRYLKWRTDDIIRFPSEKKLKADAQYHWTVEVTESLPYDWSLMLSEDKTGIAPENTFLEMNGIPGIGDEAQTVSQYAYYIHKDKVIILATCWCGTFLVYLTGMEIIQKIFNRKK